MNLLEITEPILFILVGLPGSGKSTWVRLCLATYPDKNFKIISSDDIIEELGTKDGLSYAEAWLKHKDDAAKEMNRRANIAFKDKNNIIWDQTNLTLNSRRSKLSRANGYKKFAVVFQPDQIERIRRFNQRLNETGKIIPPEIIAKMTSDFVMPTISEGFDKIIILR